jgi:hypothetical protein
MRECSTPTENLGFLVCTMYVECFWKNLTSKSIALPSYERFFLILKAVLKKKLAKITEKKLQILK